MNSGIKFLYKVKAKVLNYYALKPTGWIASSFEEFFASSSSVTSRHYRQKPNEDIAQSSDTWNDKFAPKQEADLAVHKKKIEEVRQWLVEHVSQRTKVSVLLKSLDEG